MVGNQPLLRDVSPETNKPKETTRLQVPETKEFQYRDIPDQFQTSGMEWQRNAGKIASNKDEETLKRR